jgi:hypothetical protein
LREICRGCESVVVGEPRVHKLSVALTGTPALRFAQDDNEVQDLRPDT